MECVFCGKEFVQIGKEGACSKSCLAGYGKLLVSGLLEERPMTEEERIFIEKARKLDRIKYNIRHSKNLCRSRTIILARRNNRTIGTISLDKCARCGSKEKIELHHDKYCSKKTKIIRYILEGKIIPLCQKCHKEQHKKRVFLE